MSIDRSFVEKNRASTERIRRFGVLSDAELQTQGRRALDGGDRAGAPGLLGPARDAGAGFDRAERQPDRAAD